MSAGGLSRRAALGALLGMAAAVVRLPAQEESQLPGSGPTGTLRDPSAVGAPRTPTGPLDNEEFIKAVEHRLHCTCGCNLDVYTCRTTDFSCGTSPRLHREVVALHESGMAAQEIIDTFVAKYGESILMAPKPEGFNLAGYLVPGVVILIGGAILALRLSRRARAVAPAAAPAAAAPVVATAEELERLRAALAQADD